MTEPPPKDKFLPRAEPATVFGPSSSVSRAFWVYQKGYTKARTNISPAGLDVEDLHWIKCNMSSWDPPDCPLSLPEPHLYDAASLTTLHHREEGGATRETATCPACVAIRYKKKVVQPHSFEWGQCMRASPPPPTTTSDMKEVFEVLSADKAEKDDDEFPTVTAALRFTDDEPSPDMSKSVRFPHAYMALSDGATWGTESSGTATELPSEADEIEEIDEADFDDDELVVQPGFLATGELSPPTEDLGEEEG